MIMPLVKLTCPDTEKYIEVKSNRLTIIEWGGANERQLRYYCPLCKVVELQHVNENAADIDRIETTILKKQILAPPIIEDGGTANPITYDEAIDFHYNIQSMAAIPEGLDKSN